jgi:AAA+ superfamily predicted ATPase
VNGPPSDQVSSGGLRQRLSLLARALRDQAEFDASGGVAQLGQGLYVTEADVERAFGELDWLTAEPGDEHAPEDDRVAQLADVLELSPFEQLALVAALAPELDRAFATIYAFLNDDVALRRATVALVHRLAGGGPLTPDAMWLLGPGGNLARAGLLEVDVDDGVPLPRRTLRAPSRVVAHLVGDDRPSPSLGAFLFAPVAVGSSAATASAKAFLAARPPLVYVRESHPGTAVAHAAAILEAAGGETLGVDLTDRGDDAPALARDAVREALFSRRCLVLAGFDDVIDRDRGLVDVIAGSPVPVAATGRHMWTQAEPAVVPLLVEAPDITADIRSKVWQEAVGDLDPALLDMAAAFRVAPERIPAAARAAALDAERRDVDIDADAIQHAIRTQHTGELERLARRITPRADLDDLVLPPDVEAQVREIVSWVAHRETVEDGWAMSGKGTKGRGITSLFVGRSGTGKTLTAEAVSAAIGVDMYTIDLATVVSKYIGETEKNLERIFAGAEGVNAVLFFDEADALFGKRTETSDAHDRYANIEVAYLLQRMEQFDGISILATNLRSNIDDAFARRLDFVLTFPTPTTEARQRLWDAHLPASLPVADDIDTAELARRFELSGGDIRNAALAAAYSAAAAARAVDMADLVRAVGREYRKLGRLVTEDDFGPWAAVVGPQ